MIENILLRRNASAKVIITVKTVVSCALIAMAVLLPQLVHIAFGASGGVKLLPMYLPVLIGGCILGWKWGLGIGILSPIVSFFITSAFNNPMPQAVRLPYMIAELAVFACVSGLFYKKINQSAWFAFPAVIVAEICGRGVFLLLAAIFQSVSPLSLSLVWSQIQSGLTGLGINALVVPIIVIALSALMKSDKKTSD